MQKKSIAKNAVLNTTKTVLGILFPLITFPYVLRVLGIENIGIYTFSYSFLSYFLLIAALGISTYGIREGTNIRDDKTKIEQFVSELFSINVLSTIISYVLMFSILYIFPSLSPYRKAVAILSAEIIFATLGVPWVCNVYEDFFAIAVRTIIFQILSLILIFVFIRSSNDLYKYIVILLVSNSGANIVNHFYIRRKYCKFKFTTNIDWRRHLKPILIIFSTAISVTVYVSSDSLLIGIMLNDYQVGLYGTAVKIYTIIKNILVAILMVLIPRFSILFSNNEKKQLNKLFSQVFNVLTVIMLPICVGLFLISNDIIVLVSGSEYVDSASTLRLLSLAVVFSLYAYMYAQCVLIPLKKEKIVFRGTAISAIANIFLNVFLIPFWGIRAAAITTIIAEFITLIIAYYYSRSIIKLENFKMNFFSTLIGCLGIVLVCCISKYIDSFYIRIIVSVSCSALIYFVILCLFKNPVLKMLFNSVSHRK